MEKKAARAEKIKKQEIYAEEFGRMQQENARKEAENQKAVVERYQAEVEMDEGRRQCEIDQLSKQRRAYERESRIQAEKQRQRQAELQRFAVAERFKNMETNRRFNEVQRRNKERETTNLRNMLMGQRDEFLQHSVQEKMRVSACPSDQYLKEDVIFFDDAAQAIVEAHEKGKPMLPIAKAVEVYRRQNQIGQAPQTRMVGRSQLRDYCWPGFYSKADLAYKNYEAREKCRQEQKADREKILDNCLTITELAAKEQPYQNCEIVCPIKCFQHRGVPAIASVESFAPPPQNEFSLCEDKPLPISPTEACMQAPTTCPDNDLLTKPKKFNNVEPVCVSKVPPLETIKSNIKSQHSIIAAPEPECKDAKKPTVPPRKRIWR